MGKGGSAKSGLISHGLVAQNRKARHDYEITETVEAGIMLSGSEVKSLRHGRANIAESHAAPQGDELYLFNAYIPVYQTGATKFTQHGERRPRKLLLKRREIDRLLGQTQAKGMTLVPLKLYFNDRGIAKLEIGLARGKKKYDKRQTEKDKSWQRDKARILRDKA